MENCRTSPAPLAATRYGCDMETTTSGWMRQPSTHSRAAGLSEGSPSRAPLSTHAVSLAMSASLSFGALRNSPTWGSANHGGIFLLRTAVLIALAQGRVLSYVMNDIGATPPGR